MTARKVGDHVELEQDEARAGQTGFHVRHIMAASIVLVLIGFGLVAFFMFG